MDRAHTSPILDIRTYQVEFAGGKVTELTANTIAESMYTQCDADGNKYLLLNLLLDINEHKGLWCISLHVHFPQTSVFLESWAGLQFTGEHFN